MSRSTNSPLASLAGLPGLAGLFGGFLAAGCLAVVGAGAGFLISREVLPDDTHEAQVRIDVETVWASTRETLEIMSDLGSEVTVQEDPRIATTKVDGALVQVEVEAFDIDRTIVRVQAEKYLQSASETAGSVLNRIIDRLEE